MMMFKCAKMNNGLGVMWDTLKAVSNYSRMHVKEESATIWVFAGDLQRTYGAYEGIAVINGLQDRICYINEIMHGEL